MQGWSAESDNAVVRRAGRYYGNKLCLPHGGPEIFNTDRGSQVTSEACTGLLRQHGIAVNMDGKGAWRDTVFIGRLWKSVEYEELYLRACDSVSHTRQSLGRNFDCYNHCRPQGALDRNTPDKTLSIILRDSVAACVEAGRLRRPVRVDYPDNGAELGEDASLTTKPLSVA